MGEFGLKSRLGHVQLAVMRRGRSEIAATWLSFHV